MIVPGFYRGHFKRKKMTQEKLTTGEKLLEKILDLQYALAIIDADHDICFNYYNSGARYVIPDTARAELKRVYRQDLATLLLEFEAL